MAAAGSTVLIVDDEGGARALLRELLEHAGFVVAAEAVNGAEGVQLARELKPDVVTMDLEMPVMNGAEATRQLCADGSQCVVIVSGSQSSELVGAALEAGARWHVAKRDAPDQLVQVIHSLLDPAKHRARI